MTKKERIVMNGKVYHYKEKSVNMLVVVVMEIPKA